MKRSIADENERRIYTYICTHQGVKARAIAAGVGLDRGTVNHYLYNSAFISDLCYHDRDFLWYGLIHQGFPHEGLADYCGWYGSATEFADLAPEEWLNELEAGCKRIGRNLNDTRGLIHSFRDCGDAMRRLFDDLADLGSASGVEFGSWEVCFEVRIRRARRIRIYTDVLVLVPPEPGGARGGSANLDGLTRAGSASASGKTGGQTRGDAAAQERPGYAFSLEFKMKDEVLPEEVAQAAKYAPYLEVVLGPQVNVVPALVLTQAADLFAHEPLPENAGEIAVCSGDMLFNVFDEYLGFLAD